MRKLTLLSKKGPLPSEDGAWLCALAKRLAFFRPDDFDFPLYMALVNTFAATAYAMIFVSTVQLSEVVKLSPEVVRGLIIFYRTTSDQLTDATMVIRPYIRLHAPCSSETIERFRGASLRFSIDSELVIDGGALEEHLIGPGGETYRKNLWRFRRSPKSSLFPAAYLDDQQRAADTAGIACPNLSRLEISVHNLPTSVEMSFTVGLVAARYSTKYPTAGHTFDTNTA